MPDKLTINKPVIEVENTVTLNPKVSVILVTYNHEDYIAQSIESILNQETDFDIEILIGEDDSTDDTRKICLEYAKKYPTKIRLFLHNKENKIAANGVPNGKFNLLYSIQMCRGEFIAICEGDDFWHFPQKLQIQTNFMVSNPEFKTITTDFTKLYVHNNSKKTAFNKVVKMELSDRTIEPVDIFKTQVKIMRMCTYFFKSELLKSFYPLIMETAGDIQIILHAFHFGKVKYLAVDTATYRIMNESASKTKDFSKRQRFLLNYILFMEKAIAHYNLGNSEKTYLKKQKLMYEIRESSEQKQFFKTSLIGLKMLVNGYFSKNILRNIKNSLRK
ncbi:MAG: glycosyltransferase [Flavobacteriales bacterium]|nr:glycosyltransferase [Flavobacteriales bacterium]